MSVGQGRSPCWPGTFVPVPTAWAGRSGRLQASRIPAGSGHAGAEALPGLDADGGRTGVHAGRAEGRAQHVDQLPSSADRASSTGPVKVISGTGDTPSTAAEPAAAGPGGPA